VNLVKLGPIVPEFFYWGRVFLIDPWEMGRFDTVQIKEALSDDHGAVVDFEPMLSNSHTLLN
jgi:hypothetical protein